MNICSINGTPRTIHTITLNTALTGFILLIVQNDINKPKGNEITNVNTNSKHVSLNPSNKYKVTSAKLIFSSAQLHALISYFKFYLDALSAQSSASFYYFKFFCYILIQCTGAPEGAPIFLT